MGYRELIKELDREAEERISTLRQQAEQELARFEREVGEELDRLHKERDGLRTRASRDASRTILADGEKKVLEMRVTAMRELSERLHHTALSLLPELCSDGYGQLFGALAAELPDFPWETVRINPRDREMACHHFPTAKIVADDNICGGMEVRADQGRICIINTLEKRLERAWPELLPELIIAAYREIGRDAFAADR